LLKLVVSFELLTSRIHISKEYVIIYPCSCCVALSRQFDRLLKVVMEGHQNLVMPTEGSGYPDSLGTLTVWGILKEAARVIQNHVRLLLPFALAFTRPVLIYGAISWGSKFPYTLDISPAIHARSLMQTSFTVTAIQQVTIVPLISLHIWLLANMSKAIFGCTGAP
jgi:hypothetical protein